MFDKGNGKGLLLQIGASNEIKRFKTKKKSRFVIESAASIGAVRTPVENSRKRKADS
jgi:hypothetical protein